MAKIAIDEKLIGYDTNGKKLIAAHFICDSEIDLPTQTEYTDYILCLGCTAHCITEHTDHELKSGGVWVQTVQPPADYDLLTNRPQINGHILTGNQTGTDLGLQNTLTFDNTPTQNSTNPVTSGGVWTDQQRQDMLQDEDRAALVELVDSGAKNLLKITAESQTINGVTFTINDNQTVTCNGTASGTVSFDMRIPTTVSGKTCFVSGCPTGGATANTFRQLIRDVTNQKNLGSDIGDGVEVAFPNPTENVVLRINIFAGYTANNLTFKPMLCTVADYAISPAFVPYRPSWQEMYDMILALQSGTAQ
jgi:hypothetical protein